MDPEPAHGARTPRSTVAVAWMVVLGSSLLPGIILQELFRIPATLEVRLAGTAVVVTVALLATLALARLRVLRPLLAVLLVLVLAQWVVFGPLADLPPIRERVTDPSFAVAMPAEVLLGLLVTVAMVGLLLAVHRDRHAFYLARGDLAAPAEPVRWLGIGAGDRWTSVGAILSVAISGGTLAFLLLSGTPSGTMLGAALAAWPAILFAAALNAFNEEVAYKASILSVLEGPLGRRDALRMVAAYFGIAHFYGVPYGLVGVALAWFLGWILARSMLDTRGIAWAWFIHFVQDVLIFGFMAGAAIVPGGA